MHTFVVNFKFMICLWHAILICIENAGNDAVKTSPVYKSCFRYILLKRIFISGQILIFLCLNSSSKSRTQFASSFAFFPPCCRIVTFASTHIPHSKCTVYDNDLIFASQLHHRRWSASNQRTYLKFLEMTFLATDFYLVKEKSIYNIFEIWVFSSLLMYTSIYILKMVTTPWALLFCYSWINKILSVNVLLCSSIDVISWLLWPWAFPECQVSAGDFNPQTLIRNSLHVLRHTVLDGNHRHTKSL